jgi:hypothetical protein
MSMLIDFPYFFIRALILLVWLYGVLSLGQLFALKLLGRRGELNLQALGQLLARRTLGREVAPVDLSQIIVPSRQDVVIGVGPLILDFSLGATRYEFRLLPLEFHLSDGSRYPWWGELLIIGSGAVALLAAALAAVYVDLLTLGEIGSNAQVVVWQAYPDEKNGTRPL